MRYDLGVMFAVDANTLRERAKGCRAINGEEVKVKMQVSSRGERKLKTERAGSCAELLPQAQASCSHMQQMLNQPEKEDITVCPTTDELP